MQSPELAILIALVIFFGVQNIIVTKKILEKVCGNDKSPIFPITFNFPKSLKLTGGFIMLKMANDELARFVVGSPKDKKGDDAVIQPDSLKVTSSNNEVFTVEPDETQPENNTAFKASAGRAGAAVLRIEADADLGEGVKTIFVEIPVEVTSSEAVGFGEPEFTVEKQPA